MSKRYGLSRRSFDKRIKLSSLNSINPSQRSSSPPLIEDEIFDTAASHPTIPKGSSTPKPKPLLSKSKSTKNDVQPSTSTYRKSYFETVLEKNGIIFSTTDDVHSSKLEDTALIENLKKYFVNDVNYPHNITDFLKGFEKYIMDKKLFEKLLTGSQLISDEDASLQTHFQMSIIQILLRIDFLQVKIIDKLLDELGTYAMRDNLADEIVWVRHILGQFREMDFYVDGEKFVKELIVIIESSAENEMARYELISCLPIITLDPQHDLIGVELSRILADDFSLTGVILSNLSCLSLTKSIKEQIHKQVLNLLKSAAPMNKMHNLTQYLISENRFNHSDFVIAKLRENLDWGQMSSNLNEKDKSERSTSQVLTFGIIRDSLSYMVLPPDMWLKILLPIESHRDLKPIDLLMFFILYITSHKKEHQIENLICKRISTGVIRQALLENTFRDFYPVLRDNFKKIIDMLGTFIKNKQQQVAEFGGLGYKLFMIHQDETGISKSSNHVTRTIITDLVHFAQFPGKGNTAISVLGELCICSRSILNDNSCLLMKLLHSIEKLSLSQTRITMDILCSTSYPSNGSSQSSQSDIEIFISKKLSSYLIPNQKRGIVSCVVAVRHIGSKHSGTEDINAASSSSYNSTTELSKGGPKEAATLLESMFFVTKQDPMLQGMAYDELSSFLWIHSNKIQDQLINWLCDTITNDFQLYYTTETLEEEMDGCKLQSKYCINPISEEEPTMIINVAPLVLKPNHISDVSLLSPLFRLVRTLHHIKFQGDLTSIDAVIGCAVAMPIIDENESFEDISVEQRKGIIDCIFHTINWFRECISAFITQSDEDIQIRVLSRLKLVVQLEKQFYKLVTESGIDYRPPISNFHEGQVIEIIKNKKSKSRTKAKKNDTNDISMFQETNVKTQVAEKKIQNTKSTEIHSAIFRAFDNNVMLLLKKTLAIDEEPDSFTMVEFIYLLQDIISKLGILKGLKENECQPHLLQPPVNLIKDIKLIIPCIMQNLKIVLKVLTDALEECDNIKDAHVMFFEKTMQAKTCLTMIFKIFSEILEWSGFCNTYNNSLLKGILMDFSGVKDDPQNINKLASISFNNFCEYQPVIATLPCAANFAKLLSSLAKLTEDSEYLIKHVTICKELLSEEWYNDIALADKGQQSNINLELLLKLYFYKVDLKTVVRVINWIKEEVSMLKRNTDNLKTFPGFYKTNFPLLFRSVFAAFVQSIQDRIDRPLSSTQHLKFWEAIMNTLGKLMAIIKEHQAKVNMRTLLKRSHEILTIFLRRGIKGLEVCLRTHVDEVTGILKTMQQTTRFLNAICVEAKITKDIHLLAHVPKTLRVLESIIYSVKAALVANKCSTAFMMGNLINRNIHGDIIPTQSSYVPETNSEEELPPDDSESGSDADDTEMESRSKLF